MKKNFVWLVGLVCVLALAIMFQSRTEAVPPVDTDFTWSWGGGFSPIQRYSFHVHGNPARGGDWDAMLTRSHGPERTSRGKWMPLQYGTFMAGLDAFTMTITRGPQMHHVQTYGLPNSGMLALSQYLEQTTCGTACQELINRR